MAEPRHWYIIMYDVSHPQMLRRTHKLLRRWGKALQYSVFRVRCSERGLEELRCKLEALLGPADRLLIARLCDGCASRVIVRGRDMVTFDENPPPFTML